MKKRFIILTQEEITAIAKAHDWGPDFDPTGHWWITNEFKMDPNESHRQYELENGYYPYPSWLLFHGDIFYGSVVNWFIKSLGLI